MPIDVISLWDFGNPSHSEERFREALEGASPNEQFILQTQIARTFGLRRDFTRAREILAELEPRLATAEAEAVVRYWLELGRTYCSAAHTPESRTDDAVENARVAYTRAFDAAKTAGLDGLAVDALHMMTTVDIEPDEQLAWNHKALAFMEASGKPEAKRWEASLRNNLGYALHLAGRYDEALVEFEASRAAREVSGNEGGERIARWMIAWTYRVMGRLDEALAMQLKLEEEWQKVESPDTYVYQELEILYRALGDEERATYYGSLHNA